jgi:hypothetical protein
LDDGGSGSSFSEGVEVSMQLMSMFEISNESPGLRILLMCTNRGVSAAELFCDALGFCENFLTKHDWLILGLADALPQQVAEKA